ncbi:MAG: DUF72 domain-containing protein [Alphaproteobacteria bacterium]|nr:MAG: DUF72 domain-containing protein [Alphaproteobacteria bacterium]
MKSNTGTIRAGIGGWVFPPWRGAFYPVGLRQAEELSYASRHVTAIEINGTFYRTQTPATFAKWRDETPDGFVFSLKGPRYVTQRSGSLAETGPSIERFLGSGLAELGDKLGPLLWQFAPFKAFDADDFAAFLKLLPDEIGGRALRHVVEVRHQSFRSPAFFDLLREYRIAVALVDDEKHPAFDQLTGDFVYLRLRRCVEQEPAGYPPAALDGWADRAKGWASEGRDVFLYFINGAKVRAPAAAQAFLQRLST